MYNSRSQVDYRHPARHGLPNTYSLKTEDEVLEHAIEADERAWNEKGAASGLYQTVAYERHKVG